MAMMTSIRGLASFLPFGGMSKGEGTSHIGPDLAQAIHRQVGFLSLEKLSHCVASRTASKFEGCRWDIEVMDESGKIVAHGREFGAGNRYFWAE